MVLPPATKTRCAWLWVYIIVAALLIGHGVITGLGAFAALAIALLIAIT